MSHDIVNFDIIVKYKGCPRTSKSMEPMSSGLDVPVNQHLFQFIPNVGVNDLKIGIKVVGNRGADGRRCLEGKSTWRARNGHRFMMLDGFSPFNQQMGTRGKEYLVLPEQVEVTIEF